MNLRTLKKLSKIAAPLLPLLDDARSQFPAVKDDNYHHAFISDRKHWERSKVHNDYQPHNGWTTPRGHEILLKTRVGRLILLKPPVHPRKGTMMVGGMSGYYEPEWDEQDAWSALEDNVRAHFTDYSGMDDEDFIPTLTRDLSTPRLVLAAARELIARRATP